MTTTTPYPRQIRPASRWRRRRWSVVLASGAMIASLAACGSSDSAASSPSTTTNGTAPATDGTAASTNGTAATTNGTAPNTDAVTEPGATTAPIANAITITTPGMAYEVSGTLRPGVGAITLHNTDEKNTHMMAFARLKDGVTLDQVRAALDKGEDATTALFADGPESSALGTPALVGPGESSTVTALDLQPGTYGLVCFLTAADGTPHWKMGMVATLEVSGDPATEKPASDGTITIDDEGITVPDGFAGQGTFMVTNAGSTGHNLSLARFDEATTMEEFVGAVGEAEGSNQSIDVPGGVLVGGVDELGPGQSAYLTLDLKPGHYGYLSTDDITGPELPPQHGEFTVG